MTARPRIPGCSFCIITDGRRPQRLAEELASIRALALPVVEVIVAGEITDAVRQQATGVMPDVTLLHAPELARAGRLGAMRNLGCAHARFDQLVVADDDMRFHQDFPAALRALADADVVCVRLLNPDGTRYWDWATHGGPRGHALLDYHERDEHVYVTGGLAIMRATVHDAVQWDDARGFYAGEDLDWSARLRAAGVRIAMCPDATVTHQDARYTQDGTRLRFRQDLALPERIAPQVEGIGFFRPVEPGFRWMTTTGSLSVAAMSEESHTLRFSLTSAAQAPADTPFAVQLLANGRVLGVFRFQGTQSYTASVPLTAGQSTTVTLRSSRTVPGHTVGLADERPVSVLLHEVAVIASGED